MRLITIICCIGHAPRAPPIYVNITQKHLVQVPFSTIRVGGKWCVPVHISSNFRFLLNTYEYISAQICNLHAPTRQSDILAEFAWHETIIALMCNHFVHLFWFFFLLRSFETPERSVYDESGLNYSDHANNQTECTDLGNGSSGSGSSSGSGGGGIGSKTSCLHLKAEPLGGPSSPESTSELPNVADSCAGCAGCGRSIQVRIRSSYILAKFEHTWHCNARWHFG